MNKQNITVTQEGNVQFYFIFYYFLIQKTAPGIRGEWR